MTRARERLAMTYADMRRMQGSFLPNPPSRFLTEIPQELRNDLSPGPGFLHRDRSGWSTYESTAPNGSSAARAVLVRPGTAAVIDTAARSEGSGGAGLNVGARIRHPKFGIGKILAREGSGKGLKLTIRFRDHGQKKILPAYTKLQVES
jgi:DNA helicase-2/ATP-dependent DNA helicase PcrA